MNEMGGKEGFFSQVCHGELLTEVNVALGFHPIHLNFHPLNAFEISFDKLHLLERNFS